MLTSGNQGGGDKKQGLVSTTNTRVDLNAFIRIRGGGHNRNWLFCMNQLGGVGRRWGQASGPGNRGGVSANCQRLAYRRRQQYPPKPCGSEVRGWGSGVKFPPLCRPAASLPADQQYTTGMFYSARGDVLVSYRGDVAYYSEQTQMEPPPSLNYFAPTAYTPGNFLDTPTGVWSPPVRCSAVNIPVMYSVDTWGRLYGWEAHDPPPAGATACTGGACLSRMYKAPPSPWAAAYDDDTGRYGRMPSPFFLDDKIYVADASGSMWSVPQSKATGAPTDTKWTPQFTARDDSTNLRTTPLVVPDQTPRTVLVVVYSDGAPGLLQNNPLLPQLELSLDTPLKRPWCCPCPPMPADRVNTPCPLQGNALQGGLGDACPRFVPDGDSPGECRGDENWTVQCSTSATDPVAVYRCSEAHLTGPCLGEVGENVFYVYVSGRDSKLYCWRASRQSTSAAWAWDDQPHWVVLMPPFQAGAVATRLTAPVFSSANKVVYVGVSSESLGGDEAGGVVGVAVGGDGEFQSFVYPLTPKNTGPVFGTPTLDYVPQAGSASLTQEVIIVCASEVRPGREGLKEARNPVVTVAATPGSAFGIASYTFADEDMPMCPYPGARGPLRLGPAAFVQGMRPAYPGAALTSGVCVESTVTCTESGAAGRGPETVANAYLLWVVPKPSSDGPGSELVRYTLGAPVPPLPGATPPGIIEPYTPPVWVDDAVPSGRLPVAALATAAMGNAMVAVATSESGNLLTLTYGPQPDVLPGCGASSLSPRCATIQPPGVYSPPALGKTGAVPAAYSVDTFGGIIVYPSYGVIAAPNAGSPTLGLRAASGRFDSAPPGAKMFAYPLGPEDSWPQMPSPVVTDHSIFIIDAKAQIWYSPLTQVNALITADPFMPETSTGVVTWQPLGAPPTDIGITGAAATPLLVPNYGGGEFPVRMVLLVGGNAKPSKAPAAAAMPHVVLFEVDKSLTSATYTPWKGAPSGTCCPCADPPSAGDFRTIGCGAGRIGAGGDAPALAGASGGVDENTGLPRCPGVPPAPGITECATGTGLDAAQPADFAWTGECVSAPACHGPPYARPCLGNMTNPDPSGNYTVEVIVATNDNRLYGIGLSATTDPDDRMQWVAHIDLEAETPSWHPNWTVLVPHGFDTTGQGILQTMVVRLTAPLYHRSSVYVGVSVSNSTDGMVGGGMYCMDLTDPGGPKPCCASGAGISPKLPCAGGMYEQLVYEEQQPGGNPPIKRVPVLFGRPAVIGVADATAAVNDFMYVVTSGDARSIPPGDAPLQAPPQLHILLWEQGLSCATCAPDRIQLVNIGVDPFGVHVPGGPPPAPAPPYDSAPRALDGTWLTVFRFGEPVVVRTPQNGPTGYYQLYVQAFLSRTGTTAVEASGMWIANLAGPSSGMEGYCISAGWAPPVPGRPPYGVAADYSPPLVFPGA